MAGAGTDKAINEWVGRLSESPIPVWRGSREALERFGRDGEYNGPKLTRALAHDPMVCAQILKAANTGRGSRGQIATLEQAAVMLGCGGLERLGATLPIVEERLDEKALVPLRQLQRRLFHVGYLARELVRRNRDMHYDDAFYAGLLHNLGELVLRVTAPEIFIKIGKRIHRNGDTPAKAATAVLGFEVSQLSVALAREWQLPQLLQAVLDIDHSQSTRAGLISEAVGLLHTGPRCLVVNDEETDSRLLRVSEILVEPPSFVASAAFAALTSAARYLSKQADAEEETVCEIFPAEPVDSFEDEPPAPAPHRDAQDAAINPEELRRRIEHTTSAGNSLPALLEHFTNVLREDIGLDRVVFALLSPDRTSLRGRYFRGVAADDALHGFHFRQNDGSLFTKLLEKPGAAWVNSRTAVRIKPLLTREVMRTVGTADFVAQSIFLRGRTIGLCYADRHTSQEPITAIDYDNFRQACAMLTHRLGNFSGPSNRKS